MSILSWLEEQQKWSFLSLYGDKLRGKRGDLWIRCDRCGVILYLKHLTENYEVCYGCNLHLQMTSTARIEQLIDKKTWRTLDTTISPVDPLLFRDQKGYAARLREAQSRTGLQDAIQTGTGFLNDIPVALGVMDFYFMGGSMGSVVGERLTRLAEYATEEGLNLIILCCSGGARMQEGIFSLMQMAKISAAIHIHQTNGNLLYLSVLTSPTTGGVTASFAMLGDLIVSEPRALIGFAGRRIIEQALNEKLPDDFQTAEGLLRHGLIDLIIPRAYFKQAIYELLSLYKKAPYTRQGVLSYGMRTPLTRFQEQFFRKQYTSFKEVFFSRSRFKIFRSQMPPLSLATTPPKLVSTLQIDRQVETSHNPLPNTDPPLCRLYPTFLTNKPPAITEELNRDLVLTSEKKTAAPHKFFSPSLFFNYPNQNPLPVSSFEQPQTDPESLVSALAIPTPPLLQSTENPLSTDKTAFTPSNPSPYTTNDTLLQHKLLSALSTTQHLKTRSIFCSPLNQPSHSKKENPQEQKPTPKRFQLSSNTFVVSIHGNLMLWYGGGLKLMSPDKVYLEKATCQARQAALLWTGFYSS